MLSLPPLSGAQWRMRTVSRHPANASRAHSKLRTRSPLSGEFGARNPPLMAAFPRNCPPFTPVHSHAAAQKSSGAFFRVMDRERYRKRPARLRMALRAPAGVRARTLMLNAAVWRVHTSHIMLSLRLSPERKSPPAEVE